MGLFTLVDRISLLRDCRAIMKLMVKLQRCPKPDKAELCLEVERRLQTLSSKGAKMPDAAFTIIIPIQGRDNNLFSFMQVVKEELYSVKVKQTWQQLNVVVPHVLTFNSLPEGIGEHDFNI